MSTIGAIQTVEISEHLEKTYNEIGNEERVFSEIKANLPKVVGDSKLFNITYEEDATLSTVLTFFIQKKSEGYRVDMKETVTTWGVTSDKYNAEHPIAILIRNAIEKKSADTTSQLPESDASFIEQLLKGRTIVTMGEDPKAD